MPPQILLSRKFLAARGALERFFPRMRSHVVVKVILALEALQASLALVGFAVDVLVAA